MVQRGRELLCTKRADGFRLQLESGAKRGNHLQRAELLLSVRQSGGDYGN